MDWNGEGGGNTDLGDPVYGVANGTVVGVVSDQDSATSGFGNYVVLKHDVPQWARFRRLLGLKGGLIVTVVSRSHPQPATQTLRASHL